MVGLALKLLSHFLHRDLSVFKLGPLDVPALVAGLPTLPVVHGVDAHGGMGFLARISITIVLCVLVVSLVQKF
jgi:hypothetical protein